jgi:hypothetical protein
LLSKLCVLLGLWSCIANADSRPVKRWLNSLKSKQRAVWIAAAYQPPAFATGDHDSINLLFAALVDSNANVRKYVASALGQLGLEPSLSAPRIASLLNDADADVRSHAAAALANLGSAGAEAAASVLNRPPTAEKQTGYYSPFLLPHGNDYAEAVLQQMGPAALPQLLEILQDGTSPSGRSVQRLLAKLSVKDAAPQVFALLVNGSSSQKAGALEGLTAWGDKGTDFLRSQLSDPSTRVSALLALTAPTLAGKPLGTGLTASDIRELVARMRDPNVPDAIRADAVRLLENARTSALCPEVLPIAVSEKERLAVRRAGVQAVPSVCPASTGIPALARALEGSSTQQFTADAIAALGAFGRQAASSVPLIAKAVGNSSSSVLPANAVPEAAATALANIGGEAAFQTASRLAAECGISKLYWMMSCAPILQAVARFGDPGLDVLAERAARDDGDLRTVASVLAKSGEKGTAKLIEIFRQADPTRKARLARYLEPSETIASEVEKSMPAETDPKRRVNLAEALLILSPGRLPDVVLGLTDPSYTVLDAVGSRLAALTDAQRGETVSSILHNPSATAAVKRVAIKALERVSVVGAVASELANIAIDAAQDAELRAQAIQDLIDAHQLAALPLASLGDLAASTMVPEAVRTAAAAGLAAQPNQPEAVAAMLRIASSPNLTEMQAREIFPVLTKSPGLTGEYRGSVLTIAGDKQRNPRLRGLAVSQFRQVSSGGETLVPILRQLLAESIGNTAPKSNDYSTSVAYGSLGSAAAGVLGVLGQSALVAVPDLTTAAIQRGVPYEIQDAAAEALVAMGPGVLSALPDKERILTQGPISDVVNMIGAFASTEAGKNGVRYALSSAPTEIKAQICLELGRLGPVSAWAKPELLQALASDSADLRDAAAGALLQIDTGQSGGPTLATELNEEYIRDHWSVSRELNEEDVWNWSDAKRVSGPRDLLLENLASSVFSAIFPKNLAGASSPSTSLPELWKRPPFPSARDDITVLISPRAHTLGEAQRILSEALRAAGFDEIAIYAAPNGFTLITKVERIHEDGSSFQGTARWTGDKTPLRSLSLADYLKSLFLEKPGQFRLMAFAVSTGLQLTDDRKTLTEEFARTAVVRGQRGDLPPDLAAAPLNGHRCDVLIYHFEKRPGGGVRVLLPSEFSARVHLAKAQLLPRLGEIQ